MNSREEFRISPYVTDINYILLYKFAVQIKFATSSEQKINIGNIIGFTVYVSHEDIAVTLR